MLREIVAVIVGRIDIQVVLQALNAGAHEHEVNGRVVPDEPLGRTACRDDSPYPEPVNGPAKREP